MKLKRGDKVVCVDNANKEILVVLRVYTVHGCYDSNKTITLEECPEYESFFAKRFILLPDNQS